MACGSKFSLMTIWLLCQMEALKKQCDYTSKVVTYLVSTLLDPLPVFFLLSRFISFYPNELYLYFSCYNSTFHFKN